LSYNLTYKKSKDANTNGEVSDLQYFLQDQGLLTAEPNGIFGPSTLRAVKYFQKKNGFITSGYVGPMTRAKIKEISCNGGDGSISIAPSVPVACTMEYRSCADGSAMPRDSNCKWREDKCSMQEQYKEVKIKNNGKTYLELGYDSNKKESALTAMIQVNVTAGTDDVIIMRPGHNLLPNSYSILGELVNNINYYGDTVISPAVYVFGNNVQVYDDHYIVKAGTSVDFKVAQVYSPSRMFAGSYYVKFSYYKNGNYGGSLGKTNSVTVIGENINTDVELSPSAVVTEGPSIALGYDSSNKEVSLNTKAVIKVTAGGSNLWIKKPGTNESSEVTSPSYFQMYVLSGDKGLGKGGIAFGNPDTLSNLDNYMYWVVEAGKSRNFSISSNITNVNQMFAGSYHAVPMFYTPIAGAYDNILSTKDGNYVTIVGETSPYISGVTVDQNGNITITGARLNLADNYLQVDGMGNSILSKYNPTSSSVSIIKNYQIISNLSVGYHNLKINNSKTGDSNEYGFNVEKKVPVTPIEAHGPNYNAMSCSNPAKTGLS
jgi:peptidoglycan hydrolase-like protein with peptidoglycan-binding domain